MAGTFATLVMPAPVRASTVIPFLPPTGVGIAATIPLNGVYPVTSATSPQANWMLEQWGNPDTFLPAFVTKHGLTGLTSYTSFNSRALLQVTQSAAGKEVFKMNQDGSTLSCGPSPTSPLEYDLFLSPNAVSFNPAYPSALLTDTNPGLNLSLAAMKSMVVTGNVRLSRSWVPPVPSKCSVNQGAMIYSLILKNTAVTPSEILYYQLDLTPLQCAPGTNPAQYAWCQTYRPGLTYFQASASTGSTGQVTHYIYGVDDPITSYNLPLLQVSATTTSYNFDLLPRLIAVIKAGSPSVPGVAPISQDLTGWRVSTVYYGQHIWGNIGVESFWSGMLPIVTY